MIKRVLWVGLLFLLLVTPTFTISQPPAVLVVESKPGALPEVQTIVAQQADDRVLYLTHYLEKRGSPMRYAAVDFIEAADTYNVDWTLLPSIAGLESSYGRSIPAHSYNPFGWGHNAGRYMQFRSWREAIDTVARGLRQNYVQSGPIVPRAIGRKYAESPTWTARVESIQSSMQAEYTVFKW